MSFATLASSRMSFASLASSRIPCAISHIFRLPRIREERRERGREERVRVESPVCRLCNVTRPSRMSPVSNVSRPSTRLQHHPSPTSSVSNITRPSPTSPVFNITRPSLPSLQHHPSVSHDREGCREGGRERVEFPVYRLSDMIRPSRCEGAKERESGSLRESERRDSRIRQSLDERFGAKE